MTHLIVEDDFGPFLTDKQSYKPDHGDKILFEGTETECKNHLRKLMDNIVDDSPDEFWRDYGKDN